MTFWCGASPDLSRACADRYERLCGIECHAVENMRLRKEISESYGVLHAVQECRARLGVGEAHPQDDNVNLEDTFLIDLCSGKGEL